MIWGVIWLVSVAGLLAGCFSSPDHTIRGWPALLTIGGVLVSGTVLAIGAL